MPACAKLRNALKNPASEFPPALDRHLENLGREFLIAFLEAAIGRDPENVDALAELGHAYTAQGRYEDGLRVDQRLVRLMPDHPIVHYNLGCSLALLGRREAALEAIEEAVARGFDDLGVMLNDEDLVSLRDDRRFQQLAATLEQARS